MKYLPIIFAILSEVTATFALKYSYGFTRLYPSILVVFFYICSFYFLSLSLKSIRIDLAYAIWAGAGLVLISVVNAITELKAPNFSIFLGQILIIFGIIIIHLNSKI